MHYLCVVVVVEVVYITMIPFGRRQHTVIDHISASLARMDALLSDLKIQATAASDQHCGLCCGCRSGIHNDDFIFKFPLHAEVGSVVVCCVFREPFGTPHL